MWYHIYMITVRNKETKQRLEVSIDSCRFVLYDRTAEEIGAALFQSYQAGAWYALQAAGFREDVREEHFGNMFRAVDFDFSIPLDDREEELLSLLMSEFEE